MVPVLGARLTARIVLAVTSRLRELEDKPRVTRAQLVLMQTQTAPPRPRRHAKSVPPVSSIETLARVASPLANNAL